MSEEEKQIEENENSQNGEAGEMVEELVEEGPQDPSENDSKRYFEIDDKICGELSNKMEQLDL